MMVFFGEDRKIAISNSRIYQVVQYKTTIEIFYDSGEISFLENETVVPKIDSVKISFEEEELAIDNFRAYYKACEMNRGAFYFG